MSAALLEDAMEAVERATAPRQWLRGDLKAVTLRAIDAIKANGMLVEDAVEKLMPKAGRFRRTRGLKVNHAPGALPKPNV
jgi:hypothetical protein